MIAAKCCQGLGAKEGTQEGTGLLGRESRTMAQRSRSVVEMVSKCQEVRSVGTDGPVRDDRDLWKGDRAPLSPTAMGVMEAS